MLTRFIMAFALFISLSATALDRAQIAESATDVTPLLNGMQSPNITLRTAEGDPVSLQALTMQKPTVVLFYRGGWCPYCNRQLAELKNIEDDIVKLGYQILAISPESPSKLQEQKLETEFAVTLISDEKLAAISGFGVGFYVPEKNAAKYKTYDIELTETQDNRPVLPAPSVFILDQKGTVVFNYVNPDYKTRLSADLLYQAAKLSL